MGSEIISFISSLQFLLLAVSVLTGQSICCWNSAVSVLFGLTAGSSFSSHRVIIKSSFTLPISHRYIHWNCIRFPHKLSQVPFHRVENYAGKSMHPLVDQIEHDAVAKVTGMLLEMDQPEVLHLLDSPDALKAKVAEALEVLKNIAQGQQYGGAQL